MAQIKASLVKTCPTSDPFKPVTLSKSGPDYYLSQIQKLDSVHDFGGTRGNNLATDSITKRRDTGAYSYEQMRLSFIQKYSFNNNPALLTEIPDIEIKGVSNFSYPGVGQLARFVDDIENYLMYLAIKDATTNRGKTYSNNFLCAPTKPDSTFINTKRVLAEFFSNYRDTGTGKINFIVDTPGDLTKVLKSNRSQDDFAYVLTQESAHDSAKGKPTTLSPIVIDEAYNGNGFCEAFGDNVNPSRTYRFNPNNAGNFESNFTITFTGMKYTAKPQENFSTSVRYAKQGFTETVNCTLNSLVHPTNVPQITKAVGNITKGSDLTLKDVDKSLLTRNDVTGFYTSFQTPSTKYDYTPNNQNLLDFNFTKKRAGDGLQARICQYVNSGTISLTCYKKRHKDDPAGNIAGGLYLGRSYNITKLILVTIDRVLFSYCVKNDIPAIYSGTDFFIFFNPIGKETIGGSSGMPVRVLNSYSTGGKKHIKQIVGKNQKGGNILNDFYGIINDIPYIIFKLLPRILDRIKSQNPIIIPTYINTYQTTNDDDIETYYGNNLSILIYKNKLTAFSNVIPTGVLIPSANSDEPRTLIYLNNNSNEIICKLDYVPSEGIYTITYGNKSATFNNTMILSILENVNGIITRSVARAIASSGIGIFRSPTEEYLTSVEEDYLTSAEESDLLLKNIGITQEAGQRAGTNDKKLLDLYIDKVIGSPNLLDNGKIKEDNFIALLSYINILTCYEVAFCYDNDIYEQRFNKINGLEVTNCIGLYIMYDLLLNEFSEQITKISYNLMEYFINSGDTSKNYLSISTDLMELLQYIYCDDTRLSESLNAKINQQIQSGIINTSDPIFIASQTYFADLFGRIQTKQSQVEAYLNGTNTDVNIGNYIKNNLSMYGFMNMTNDYINRVIPPSAVATSTAPDLARGFYPSRQEREQQLESQKTRAQSQQIIPTKSPLKPFQGKTMTMQQLKQKNIESAPEGNIVYSYNAPNRGIKTIGGKYKTRKNYLKNRKTRKNRKPNRKPNRKHRHIRKTKKNNKRTRKH